MTNYEQVAEAYELMGLKRAKYILYMRTRWGDTKDEEIKCQVGYASEWAERFKRGVEFECSDGEGQNILKEMEKIK